MEYGYTSRTAWKHEGVIEKAEVLEWYLYRNIRNGYEQEKQEEKAKADAKKKKPDGSAAHGSRYGNELLLARLARMKADQDAGG